MRGLIVLVSVLSLISCAGGAGLARGELDFSGVWRLQPQPSGEPTLLIRAMGRGSTAAELARRPPGRTGEVRRRGLESTRGMGASSRVRKGQITGMRGRVVAAILDELQSEKLVIEQSADALQIDYGIEGTEPSVYRFGKTRGGERDIKSTLSRKGFELEFRSGSGSPLRRTFEMSEDGQSMRIVSTVGRAGLRQYYRRETPAAPNDEAAVADDS